MRLVVKLLPCAAILAMATIASADVWDEIANGGGDAGDFPGGSFQTQVSNTIFDIITGNNADGIDSYLITITDAANFFIFDSNPSGADTKAFLWHLDGSPKMANDDNPGNPFGFNFGFGDQNTHTGNIIGNPGVVQNGEQYILSIGAFGDTANDAAGSRMFIDDLGDFSALTGPTGAGPFSFYSAAGAGAYTVNLGGAQFGKIPAPGAGALLGIALFAGRRRRRRN